MFQIYLDTANFSSYTTTKDTCRCLLHKQRQVRIKKPLIKKSKHGASLHREPLVVG